MKTVKDYKQYEPLIACTRLFANIPQEHYEEVFQELQASFRIYDKEESIQRLGQPFFYSGIVLDGCLEGSFISEAYTKINMDHFTKGRSFGEALACIQTPHSPIQIKALEESTVLLLNLHQILESSSSSCQYKETLQKNLISILASQNVFSNLKLRIMSQKSLRDRVLIYLHSLVPDTNGYLHVPFTKTALAEFLGVNRSALSRELGRMQDEGLIIIDGNLMKLQGLL